MAGMYGVYDPIGNVPGAGLFGQMLQYGLPALFGGASVEMSKYGKPMPFSSFPGPEGHSAAMAKVHKLADQMMYLNSTNATLPSRPPSGGGGGGGYGAGFHRIPYSRRRTYRTASGGGGGWPGPGSYTIGSFRRRRRRSIDLRKYYRTASRIYKYIRPIHRLVRRWISRRRRPSVLPLRSAGTFKRFRRYRRKSRPIRRRRSLTFRPRKHKKYN